jgi:hypothetical protein
MGLLRRIADKLDPLETRSDGDPFFPIPGLAGERAISPRLAENLSTVLACVGSIAGAISSLPVYVYQRQEKGRVLVENHPLMRLVRNGPNRHQSCLTSWNFSWPLPCYAVTAWQRSNVIAPAG